MPEITSAIRSSSEPDYRVEIVGGHGWTKHVVEVMKEMDDGVRYFVDIQGALVDVEVMSDRAHPYLRTDPRETAENVLLRLPERREEVV
jgi:hypothetical protein